MKKLLLTAFDPFGGEKINPALEAVKQVRDSLDGVRIIKLEVPTVFGKAIRVTREAILLHRPDAVLCFGQAGGRHEMCPERVAINLDDARIPDNEGNQPIDEPVRTDGPAAYFATLPVKAMVQAILDLGIPARLSNSAGTYVCNHLMYGVMDTLARECPTARGGFMHVPYIPEQTAGKWPPAPSLHLQDIVRGIEAAIRAIIQNPADVKIPGGREH